MKGNKEVVNSKYFYMFPMIHEVNILTYSDGTQGWLRMGGI